MKSKGKKENLILKAKNKLLGKKKVKQKIVKGDSKHIPLSSINAPNGGKLDKAGKKLKEYFMNKGSAICFNFDMSPKKRDSVIGAFDSDDSFTYKGRTYLKDSEAIYYNVSLQMDCIDYHVDFSLPLMRNVKVKNLLKSFVKEYPSIIYILNPLTAKRWLDSSLVKELLITPDANGDVDNMTKFTFFMVGLILIILLYTSGIFSKIGGIFS